MSKTNVLDRRCILVDCGECPLADKGICNDKTLVKVVMGELTLKEMLDMQITFAQERIKDCMEIVTRYSEKKKTKQKEE